MSAQPSKLFSLMLLSAGLLVACATTHPVAYQGLQSSGQLAANPQHKSGHVPFLYSTPSIDWSKYTTVILDPVTVYGGVDEQFGKLSDVDRKSLADYMQVNFSETLRSRYALASAAGPDVLRVHVTLTGASGSTPVLATVRQIMPLAAVISTVQSAADSPSGLLGSVTYAVEIYDSSSNELLRAFVAKQYPAAENIPASIGILSAAKTGIRKGAKALLEELQ